MQVVRASSFRLSFTKSKLLAVLRYPGDGDNSDSLTVTALSTKGPQHVGAISKSNPPVNPE